MILLKLITTMRKIIGKFFWDVLLSIQRNTEHLLHGLEFHMYQLKCHKPYIVVIRGLHQTTSIDDIKTELTNMGHNPRTVANMIVKKISN